MTKLIGLVLTVSFISLMTGGCLGISGGSDSTYYRNPTLAEELAELDASHREGDICDGEYKALRAKLVGSRTVAKPSREPLTAEQLTAELNKLRGMYEGELITENEFENMRERALANYGPTQ